MEKITRILKKYWWIWLILLLISALFLIFGASKIRSFVGNVFSTLVFIALSLLCWAYTFGREQTKSWGVFRILGIVGVLFFVLTLYLGPFDEGKNNFNKALDQRGFNFLSLGLVFSLFFFVLGEIFLYLENLQNSIKAIERDILFKEKKSNTMTCPRCYGKGFVDLNDIKRLGMDQEWGQGFCRYCEGEGEVEKGKTKILNPLRTDIGPAWHESENEYWPY